MSKKVSKKKLKVKRLKKIIKIKRIGFIGGANTGKDTLSHWLFVKLKLKDRSCYYISEMAEQALMRGMSLGTVEGQLWMCGSQMAKETEAQAWKGREFIICNRTIIDQAAYSKFLSKEAFRATLEIASAYLTVAPYDLIFLMHPLGTFTKDGVRIERSEKDIKRITQSMLEMAELFSKQFDIPIVHIKSNTKIARQREIMKHIKERFL